MTNIIKSKRKALGLTQLQFATQAKIPLRTYKRYEANKDSTEHRIPDAVTAIRIAKTLGSTVENLWGEKAQALKP